MTEEELNRRVEKGHSAGWVYLVQADGDRDHIKIGWAKDPSRRVRHLQTGQAARLNLLAEIPGTRSLEADIHRRLYRMRVSGEWFLRLPSMKLLRPVIDEQGIFLTARCTDSRTIPEVRRFGRLEKREYIAKTERVG